MNELRTNDGQTTILKGVFIPVDFIFRPCIRHYLDLNSVAIADAIKYDEYRQCRKEQKTIRLLRLLWSQDQSFVKISEMGDLLTKGRTLVSFFHKSSETGMLVEKQKLLNPEKKIID